MRYNLTQLSAAEWCLIPAGTYRDYEQGRSEPVPIIAAGIRARIHQYEVDYEGYLKKKTRRGRKQSATEPEAITA